MDLRVFTEPQQGASYENQLALALTAQDCGYSAFFRSDHYLAMDGPGLPGPADSWVTLAGLARETSGIHLGTLVSSVTFRHPGPTAISVAQVDRMSGGRVELGLGAGWMQAEHTAYGIPFPSAAERFDLLADALAVITGMWRTPEGETFGYRGRTVTVADSPELAARYADEFNLPFVSMEDAVVQFERVRGACHDIGRDAAELAWSVALVACVGADNAEVAARARAIGRDPGDLRVSGLAGTPAEVVDRLGQWQEATGVQRVYLQMLDLQDLAHTELVAAEVVPQLAAAT